ncbi:MAG: hypothetical protein RBG13Loki_1076 [Promethearchaeota archaeon CR_4]|nr:MAG: hypothetical protein RBG13Loki_1076 [Candidatus Lokiarchaeota archaeon CR_4]
MDKILDIARQQAMRFGFSSAIVTFRQKKQVASIRLRTGIPTFSFAAGVKKFPEEIIAALIFTLLARLKKNVHTMEYQSQRAILIKYLKEKADAERQKMISLRRSQCNPQGHTYNLEERLKEVVRSFREMFLDYYVNSDILITWGKRTTYKRFGLWHAQSRVIEVSKTLDAPSVPVYVVNFIVYHEMLHAIRGIKQSKRPHNVTFRNLEKKYPQYKEANEFLSKIHRNRGILPV